MGIGDLFRPTYKHSDAAVRADAVRSLPAEETELLIEVARGDADASVRALAIDKLAVPELLADVAQHEPEAELAQRARRRAAEIWVARALAATDDAAAFALIDRVAPLGHGKALVEVALRGRTAPVRAHAAALLSDARALAEVVRGAADADTWTSALRRIRDGAVLRAIAIDEERKDVSLAALELVDNRGDLEAVAARGRNAAVRARANKRLQPDGVGGETGVAAPEKMAHAERVQLCRRVEELSGSHDWTATRRGVEAAEAEWRALGDGPDAELAARFRAAAQRFHERHQRYAPLEPVMHTKEVATATVVEAGPEAQAEATAERDERDPGDAPVETEASAPSDTEASAHAQAEAETDAAEEADPMLQPAAADAQQSMSPEERKQANLADFVAFTARLSELADKCDKIKTADRWLHRADEKLTELGALPEAAKKAAMDKFTEARRKLFIRAGELREVDDWKRWANVPKQEELIKQVEGLLTSPDERGLAKRLKNAQNEWREVGPAPRDKAQELWKKFKEVCDQVYDKIKEQRSVEAGDQKLNLDRKTELCVRAEELAQSTDWGPAADKIKALQAEWKSIGPVPRRQSDKIWNRFRGACDQFFAARRPHLERTMDELNDNLAAKEALCQEVEALATSDVDPDTSLRKLPEFRRRWRDIGQVPRRDFRALGDRFNAACDRVASKREEIRSREERERRARLNDLVTSVQVAIAEITGEPLPAPPAPRVVEAAPAPVAAEAAAVEAAPVGFEAAPVEFEAAPVEAEAAPVEFEAAPVEAEAAPVEFEAAPVEAEAAPVEAEAAPVEAEAAPEAPAELAEPPAPPEPPAPIDIVQATLALRTVRKDIGALKRLDDEERDMLQRAGELVRRAVEVAPERFSGTELDPDVSRKRKEKLLAKVEKLVGKDKGKPVDSAQDMAAKLRAALADRALGGVLAKNDTRANEETVNEARESWARLGPVPGDDGRSLEERFRAACRRALGGKDKDRGSDRSEAET